jgi:hypothetical protein
MVENSRARGALYRVALQDLPLKKARIVDYLTLRLIELNQFNLLETIFKTRQQPYLLSYTKSLTNHIHNG